MPLSSAFQLCVLEVLFAAIGHARSIEIILEIDVTETSSLRRSDPATHFTRAQKTRRTITVNPSEDLDERFT